MSLQLAAQHLANQGRGPDDTLVHMSRDEVKNLNTLAMTHGGRLTINPHTGLPEAGFLSMILPMVAGAALGPAGFGLTAMQAGLAVGAGSYLLNPRAGLMGGLSAGLGGYGGAGLGAGLGNLGATSEAGLTGGTTANEAVDAQMKQMEAARAEAIKQQALEKNAAIDSLTGRTDLTPAQIDTAYKPQPQLQPYTADEMAQNRVTAMNEYQATAPKTAPQSLESMTPEQRFSSMNKGLSALVDNPSAANIKQLGGGSYTGLAQMGLAAAAPAAPDLMKQNGLNMPVSTASKQQSVPHYRFNPGMVTPTPAAGATGTENTYFNPSYTALSDEEAAKLYPGYPAAKAAGGGLMGYAGGGTPYEPISGNSDVTAQSATANNGSPTGSVLGDFGYAVSNQSVSPVAAAIADAAMSALSSTSVNSSNAVNGLDSNSDVAAATGLGSAAGVAGVAGEGSNGMGSDVGGEGGGSGSAAASSDGGSGTGSSSDGGSGSGSGGDGGGGGEARGGLSPLFKHHMATGGISDAHYNLGGYSDGGRLLRGPGDGVSDSIPAVIGKKQPARLADGEFVVPARIVSEIGNGSTEAGARKLYAMMDRIQAARGKTVGKGKVAKNTKADKYLPA